ncbi:TonB-dependent receptor [Verrucomicrobia bacterium LW23]|nr:TonB-dependent receptor [Verrucomicrobia bacterium LW23]
MISSYKCGFHPRAISAFLAAAAFATVALLPLGAQAQPASSGSSAASSDEVVVTARREDKASASLTVPSREEARRTLDQVAGGTNYINADEYKKGRVANLKDALDFQPGVIVQPRFGSDEARVSIRGSGLARTFHGRGLLLMQDGVPLNQADGGFDMQSFDGLAVDYMEVYRGANAIGLGGTTFGGTIDVVSPTGYTASPLQARFEAGSFGYLRGQVSSGQVLGPVDYYASLSHYSTDGFREHSQQNAQRFFSNAGYRASQDFETRFFLNYISSYSELPGDLTKAQLEANPEQAAGPLPGPVSRFDRVRSNWLRNYDLVRIANATSLRIDAEQRLDMSAGWTWKSLDHPILYVIDQLTNDWSGDIHYTNTCELFGLRNKLVVGLAPTFGTVEANYYLNNAGNRGRRFYDASLSGGQAVLYAQDELSVTDKLALIAGTQFIWAHRAFEEKIPLNRTHDEDYWGFNPSLGARYDVTPTAHLFTNVSRSFEPPTFSELTGNIPAFPEFAAPFDAFTPVDAQTATTFEIGTRGEAGRFRWDLAYYHSWIDHELLAYQIAPGLDRTVNGTATHHQGVEVGLDVTLWEGHETVEGEGSAHDPKDATAVKEAKDMRVVPTDKLVLRQVYNWSDFYFDSDPVYGSNQLPGFAEHYYRAELMYTHPCGFYIGPNVEWSPSSYFVDYRNTLSTDPYALLGLKAGFKWERANGQTLNLFFEAKNLTDETYAATTSLLVNANGADNAVFSPGDGRAFYGGIEWKF